MTTSQGPGSWRRCLGIVALGVFVASCMATAEPMRTVEVLDEPRADAPASQLIVMFPGMGDDPEAYAEHGFIEGIERRGVRADIVSVDAHLGYYTKRELLPRLRADVFEPARAKGYESVWVVGISLGGLGALLSAQEFEDQIDGVVVLSPFLGRRPALRRIAAAGGATAWEPPAETSSDYTVELWRWLRAYATEPAERPPMYFAYGTKEGTPSFPMLAELLPPERVFAITGGHEWDTWSDGWTRLLGTDVFRDEPSR